MPAPLPLDPRDYVVVPAVFVLDEFVMSDDKGNPVANVDKKFLEDTAVNMLGREQRTGDLCPIVIGHTEDDPKGSAEAVGPPLVGYARNWQVLPFFDTEKFGLAVDCWILKTEVDRVRRFPRRSSEVWVSQREIDPISFLGATTPCRDLGLLKLSRNVSGTLVAVCAAEGDIFAASLPLKLQRDTTVPNDMTAKPDSADPKQGGEFKELAGKIDALAAMFEKFLSAQTPGAPGAGATPAPGADAAPGTEGEDDLESLLASLGEGGDKEGGDDETDEEEADEHEPPAKGRKGEEPVKNAREQALVEQNEKLRVRLSRIEVKAELTKLAASGANVNPDDDELVSDLVILPEDVRARTLVRLSRTKTLVKQGGGADDAVANATTGRKRVTTDAEKENVIKLARKKGIGYKQAAEELGFEVAVG
jgi:hypothetical protein